MTLTKRDVERLKEWLWYALHKYNGARLDEFVRELTFDEVKSICDRLSALERVREAAAQIVRPSYRQSKEAAPLEYALWEAVVDCPPLIEGEYKG